VISRIHKKLGTAGFIISIVALVAAMGGAAYAATKLNSTQKKEVEKIAKKYAGKNGAPGATGPQGPAGPAGAKGDAGVKGDTGAEGKQGIQGIHGKNIEVGTATTTPVTGDCPEVGGVTVQVEGESATKKHVCNGNPAEYPETLPSGKSETGVWSIAGYSIKPGLEEFFAPISFPIKLGFTPTVIWVPSAEADTPGAAAGCPGKRSEPEAAAGNLCVYAFGATSFVGAVQAAIEPKSGVILDLGYEGAETEAAAYGSWAVTAP
jgi:hypothetical protein